MYRSRFSQSEYAVKNSLAFRNPQHPSAGTPSGRQPGRAIGRSRVNPQSRIEELPMAGLEPARAFKSPTDFKSVASAISPHRRLPSYRVKLTCGRTNTFFCSTPEILGFESCRLRGDMGLMLVLRYRNRSPTIVPILGCHGETT